MDEKAAMRWKNVLVTLMADGEVNEDEKTMLEAMRKRLGLTEEEARDLARQVREHRGNIRLGGTAQDRLAVYKDLVEAVHADQTVTREEQRLLDTLAEKLDLSPAQIGAIKKQAQVGTPGVLGPEEAHAAKLAAAQAPLPETTGRIHEKTGIELIDVPESTFVYGDMSVGVLDKKKHVSAFAIGKYPVTNEQWMQFEKETGYDRRKMFGERYDGPRQPVVGVSFEDAKAFCRWAGLRLPSEVEWERAARGTDARCFPWGDTYPSADLCHFGINLLADDAPRTFPVGCCVGGESPAGCHDMAGNVDEWTENPDTDKKETAPIRGANWLSAPYALNIYYRRTVEKESRLHTLGFRVTADV